MANWVATFGLTRFGRVERGWETEMEGMANKKDGRVKNNKKARRVQSFLIPETIVFNQGAGG